MSDSLNKLLISGSSRRRIDNFLSKPSHALIITGAAGSGKESLARAIASQLLGVDDLSKYPYFIEVIKPKDKQEISIDEVRKIIKALELKIAGNKAVDRVILINEANNLSTEGQNSLLKILEEPAPKTVIILTSPSIKNVLPTIASRAQELPISSVRSEEADKFYKDQYSPSEISRAWQLSGGLAGLLSALLENKVDHPLREAIELAKKLISQSKYERLIELDKIGSDKPTISLTLEALSKILSYLHRDAIQKGNINQARKILGARREVNQALNSISGNTNAKLVVLDLTLNLPL